MQLAVAQVSPQRALRSCGLSVSGVALAGPWVLQHPVPTAALALNRDFLLQPANEPNWVSGSWERRMCRDPGTRPGELVVIYSLFHSTDARLVLCLVLTARDTG